MVHDLLVQPSLPSFIRGGKASLNLHGHRNVCLWRSPLELRSAGVGNLTLPEQVWDLCFSDIGQSLHNKEQIILFLEVEDRRRLRYCIVTEECSPSCDRDCKIQPEPRLVTLRRTRDKPTPADSPDVLHEPLRSRYRLSYDF